MQNTTNTTTNTAVINDLKRILCSLNVEDLSNSQRIALLEHNIKMLQSVEDAKNESV